MNKENISKVYLLSVPLDSTYKNTLYFSNKSAQQSYFESKIKKSYTGFTYLRKDNQIYVPDHIDNIYNANYVMYQNTHYKDKWFYAFIKDMRYESDDCTIIDIETDVIQTWLFEYSVLPSFIEREHVKDDTIGLHTIPEGLETGEYVNQYVDIDELYDFKYINETYIVLAVSENGLDLTYPSGSKLYNGVFSGLYYLVFATPGECESYIRDIQDDITSDIIYSAFVIPKELFYLPPDYEGDPWFKPEGKNYNMAYLPYNDNAIFMKSAKVKDLGYLDGSYVPRNKKLLTYPYRFMLVSNNAGSIKDYKYELFDGNIKFNIEGVVSPGCAIKLTPYQYNMGKSEFDYTPDDYMEGLDAPKLPTCGWTNDSYLNWLTQNAVNIPLNIIGGVVGGAVSGGAGGAIAGGIGSITNTVSQVYEKSLAPVTAKGGVNQGDLLFAKGLCYTLYKRSIKEEYAKIIDEYFDMFGYKVNRVKTPESNHMKRYWYTKTIDANISGDIPKIDIEKIKSCYDNGLTFWKDTTNFCIYPSVNSDGTIKNANR